MDVVKSVDVGMLMVVLHHMIILWYGLIGLSNRPIAIRMCQDNTDVWFYKCELMWWLYRMIWQAHLWLSCPITDMFWLFTIACFYPRLAWFILDIVRFVRIVAQNRMRSLDAKDSWLYRMAARWHRSIVRDCRCGLNIGLVGRSFVCIVGLWMIWRLTRSIG